MNRATIATLESRIANLEQVLAAYREIGDRVSAVRVQLTLAAMRMELDARRREARNA